MRRLRSVGGGLWDSFEAMGARWCKWGKGAIHHRRSIRLQGYDYTQCGAYFVTICTKHNVAMFGEVVEGVMYMNEGGKIAQRLWHTLPKRFPSVELDAFVIMPNHIHGILVHAHRDPITPTTPSNNTTLMNMEMHAFAQSIPDTTSVFSAYRKDPRRRQHLSEMIRTFKAVTSYTVRRNGMPDFAWKHDYYERIIRNEQELEFIRLYIANNPAKWQDDTLHPNMLKPDV